MSPLDTRDETTGDVYVLSRYVGNREVREHIYHNAERPDTDLFYEEGYYDDFPDRKKHYEDRRAKEKRARHALQDWSAAALDALELGKPMPYHRRDALPMVLEEAWHARRHGVTRPELCRTLNRDGGKISGVLSDLHDAGIIFPLEGVRR